MIVLARHGRPAWDYDTPIPGRALAKWLQGEREAPLAVEQQASPGLASLVRTARCVMVSPLRRSLDSAHLLAPAAEPLTDACFSEAELPSAIPWNLRLPPEVWTWLVRAAWFCGWSAGVENFRAARARASRAATALIGQAEAWGAVVLVGHGLMNVLIARELRRRGWTGPRFPPRQHWGWGTYERVAA